MDRIFDQSEVTRICEEIIKILKESESYMEEMKSVASSAESAADLVPADVRDQGIYSAASGQRSQLDETDIDSVVIKLEDCKTRAADLIPEADTQYAKETDQLTSQAEQIQEVLRQMREFLVNTPLTDMNFKTLLEVESRKWNEVLDDATAAVNKLLMNIKGEETKSVWYSKDPVNLSTGNFICNRADLIIKGSEPFLFRRFYNSVNNRTGVLGRDWNHNYEIRLETKGEEKTLLLEDGKEERFSMTLTGTYVSIYQSNGTLKQVDHGYEYCTREQMKYRFDLEGYCVRQETLKGDCVKLFYETTMKGKYLKKIEKESGEFFELSYDGEGYLCAVADHAGRRIVYEMQGELLTGVSTPDGHWHRYGYTAEGKLECVQNPEEIITVENTFDEQMRTTKQRFPDGGTMMYAYDDARREVELTERNGSKIIYVHDEKFRDIKHIYSDGEERFEYNKRNQRTVFIDKQGNKTQYAYDQHGNRTRIINALGNRMDLQYGPKNQLSYAAIDGKQKVRNRYDEAGNLVETQDAEGNTYQFHYKKPGQVEQIIQPDSGVVKLEYDKRGNIIRLTDPNGIAHRFAYDDLNQVTEAVDGNGNRTSYTYDSSGNIKQVTNANEDTRKYTYNANHKVTRIEDFDGSVILREYNALNRPSKVVDKMGRATLLTYDAMWNLARVTQPNGARTTFIYNEHNRLSRIKDANGNVVRYAYDTVGNRIGATNELGHQTKFSYDALGRLTEAVSPEGDRSNYTYNAEGQVTKVQDALGNEVKLEYNGNEKLIKETNPLGESRSYTYTSMGKVETVTNEAGQTTTYTYEKGGRLAKITYPEGGQASYTYDGNGNVKTYTSPKGYVMSYTYDVLDQMVRVEGSRGEVKTYAYDSMGNVISMTDGRGAVTRYEYSLTGKLVKVTDPLGNETVYQYDDRDRLLEICQSGKGIDEDLRAVQEQNRENCRITQYEHDMLGRVTKITDGLGHAETYEYDKAGQLLAKIDKEGYLTRYGYTPSGAVNHIQYADGREVRLSYNPIRQLQEIKDWLGITKIENDALGRVQKVIYPDGKDVSYTYGVRGERTGILYPDGENVTYGYDEYTRLSNLNQGGQSIFYEYDDTGFLTKKSFPNRVETRYCYDEKGRIRTLVHSDSKGVLDEYRYEYDQVGNRTCVTKQRRDLRGESGVYEYGYDPLGRLTEVTKDGMRQKSYTYDAFGNRSSRKADGVQTRYEYNAVNQLITRMDHQADVTYTYDKRGNLTQVFENGESKSRYLYGSTNQLEEAVNLDSESAWYRYDGLGHRVGKTVGGTGMDGLQTGLETQIFAPVREVNYRIDLTRQYHNLLQKTEEGSRQIYLWDSNAAGLLEDGETEKQYYYLQDELGSPVRLLYQNGEVKESYGYDEFGQERYQTRSQPFGYTGYQQDPESKTYFAQARYYQPETGRFLSQDIIPGCKSAPLMMNRYSYCYNHPTGLVDRNGMLPSLDDIGDTLSDWGDAITEGVGTIAEAVSKPVEEICSQVVEWGNQYPDIRDKILDTAKPVVRALCNDSPGVLAFTYATQQGYADGLLETFDFHKDDCGIYHTSTDCWQQYLGYNDLYDWAFDAGTSMKTNQYPVKTSDGEEYCIWMWKGDYVNLGAGAETGIYKGGEPHWDTAVDDALPMTLALYDKDGNTILVYDPTDPQWWITGFDPMTQGEEADDLEVIGSIDFSSNPELWIAFEKKNRDEKEWCFDEENKTAYYMW